MPLVLRLRIAGGGKVLSVSHTSSSEFLCAVFVNERRERIHIFAIEFDIEFTRSPGRKPIM
jgi:hypothetical protein